MGALGRFGAALRDLAFPKRAVCVGCGNLAGCDLDWLCPACAEQLEAQWVGGRAFAVRPPIALRAHAYVYRGAVPGVVRALKYGSVTGLAERMAADMARACGGLRLPEAPLVVPAPMHARRLRSRGYNQAELLSRALSKTLGFAHAGALYKLRNTRQQARLSHSEREENLRNSFGVRGDVRGRAILLIDDVYTTGATLHACAQALQQAGCGPIYALTFAAAGFSCQTSH